MSIAQNPNASWLPQEILNYPDEEAQILIDKATLVNSEYDCEDKKTCPASEKLDHIKALLLLIRDNPDIYQIYSRQDFAENFMAKMAELCLEGGNRNAWRATSEDKRTRDAYEYETLHKSDFCLDAKYSNMLLNDKYPIIDVLMMIPYRYLQAYGL